MSDENDRQIVAPLMSVVKATGTSVWIEYHSSCSAEVPENIPLKFGSSAVEGQREPDALSRVRTMLQEDNGFSIRQTRPGIIDVRSTNVWSPLLQVKLNGLKLNAIERYNPNAAIEAAVSASQIALQELRARPVIRFGGLQEEPSEERPHLKASSRYETLHDLLDDVVQTFGGVLVYKECGLSDGTHLFDIRFYRK
jgi:hypothetical protein